jgi:hypothetical protein
MRSAFVIHGFHVFRTFYIAAITETEKHDDYAIFTRLLVEKS